MFRGEGERGRLLPLVLFSVNRLEHVYPLVLLYSCTRGVTLTFSVYGCGVFCQGGCCGFWGFVLGFTLVLCAGSGLVVGVGSAFLVLGVALRVWVLACTFLGFRGTHGLCCLLLGCGWEVVFIKDWRMRFSCSFMKWSPSWVCLKTGMSVSGYRVCRA